MQTKNKWMEQFQMKNRMPMILWYTHKKRTTCLLTQFQPWIFLQKLPDSLKVANIKVVWLFRPSLYFKLSCTLSEFKYISHLLTNLTFLISASHQLLNLWFYTCQAEKLLNKYILKYFKVLAIIIKVWWIKVNWIRWEQPKVSLLFLSSNKTLGFGELNAVTKLLWISFFKRFK